MAIRGRARYATPNVVTRLPDLPYPLKYGRLSWSESLTNDGTATINYLGVPATEIRKLLDVYDSGLPTKGVGGVQTFTLYGTKYEVSGVSYDRSISFIGGKRLEQYNVTVQARQPEEKLKDTDLGLLELTNKDVVLSDEEILSDSFSLGLMDSGYNGAELTWGDNSTEDSNSDPLGLTVPVLKPPTIEVLSEGDKDLTTPPPNTKVLRDSTSNFDETGFKKILKTTTRINGQLARETAKTYGFSYTYSDIHAGDGVLYSESPEDFWVQIEDRSTTYNYKRAGASTLLVQIVVPPPETGTGLLSAKVLGFIVAPGYESFAQVSIGAFGGLTVTFQSNAEYLVSQITSGWKMVRLKKETDGRNSLTLDDPYYPYFFPKKVPFYSQTVYFLRNSRGLFGEKVEPPFRIEWRDYKSLPDRYKQRFSVDNDVTTDGKVAFLYPDPNYVEPFYIAQEYSYANSFTWALDPERQDRDPGNPANYVPGTNRILPPDRLISGEESISHTNRLIINNDRHTEYLSEYSSQDPGFDNSAERISFREMSGKPPEPQNRKLEYEEKQVSTTDRVLSSKSNRKYLIYTANARFINNGETGGSVNVPNAKNLSQAIAKVKDDLARAHMQASTGQITAKWFYPGIKSGDNIKARSMIPGRKVVTSVSWNLDYKGTNNDYGEPFVTTPGTQISIGLYKEEPLTVKPSIDAVPDESGGGLEPDIRTSVLETTLTIGDYIPSLATRRNY